MAERLDLPPTLTGDEQNQLEQMWSYLYQLAETLSDQLGAIGDSNLTDTELQAMSQVLSAARNGNEEELPESSMNAAETLKSLIIKTASFVQTALNEFRTSLFGSTTAEGQLGRYVRKARMNMVITPDGDTREYTLQEIISGVSTYEVNAKNYIKTGLLYYDGSIPVYGVAVGKDVVTFSEDGTETYRDGNKVAMFTDGELAFYQNGAKLASYKGTELAFFQGGAKMISISSAGVTFYQGGSVTAQLKKDRLSLYSGGVETFYLMNGKIYCADDLTIASGKKLIITTTNFTIDSSGNVTLTGKVTATSGAIGGWTLAANRLHSGSGNSYVGLDSGSGDYALWAGNETAASAPFSVKRSGAIKATSGTVGGWTLGANILSSGSGSSYVALDSSSGTYALWAGAASAADAPFAVTKAGKLYASGAEISGKLTADTGKIGGWTIGTNRLSSGSGSSYVALDSNPNGSYAIWAGAENAASAKFSVSRLGYIKATGADFEISSGSQSSYVKSNIRSSSAGTGSSTCLADGTVGGWTLGSDKLYSTSYKTGLCKSVTDTDVVIWAGNTSGSGSNTSLQTSKFYVLGSGEMHATGAVIGGTITATSGTFGNGTSNLTVGTSEGYGAIYSGLRSTLADSFHEGIYIGANGISVGGRKEGQGIGQMVINFKVDTVTETCQIGILKVNSRAAYIGTTPGTSSYFTADSSGTVYATALKLWNGTSWVDVDPAKVS